MTRRLTFVIVMSLLLASGAFAAGVTPEQTSAICQARSTCVVGKTFPAGSSASGSALTVVAVRLGLRDKPDDAPDDGCRNDDKFDGGEEYWLLDGTAAPKRLLKFCNDGYGAAGVGEDHVSVTPNSLAHTQIGGSAWRWESRVAYTLSPWKAVAERDCSYHDASPDTGTVLDIDFRTMSARSIAKDAARKWDDVGCPDWPTSASQHFTAEPASGVLGAFNVVVPILGSGPEKPNIPNGTGIGNCVPAMTTSGTNGFVVFGNPAPAEQAAELRVVALSMNTLLIQVYDPLARASADSAGDSWVNLPHVEVWIGLNSEQRRTRLQYGDLAQIAVDLNGKVHPGVGKKLPPPSVERWEARDAAGHPVVVMRLAWSDDTQLLNGVGIVYSQAEAGKQARLVANTSIVKNHPLYVPEIVDLSAADIDPKPPGCRIQNSILSLE